MSDMNSAQISLPVFGQVLEPEGIAPAQDFADSAMLVCSVLPSIELRARIRFIMGRLVRFRLGEGDEVPRLMKFWRAELSPQIDQNEDIFVSGFEDDEELKDMASEAPVIRLVNHLFARALDLNASDIHFEPFEQEFKVRYRVDGTLFERTPPSKPLALPIISRLKVLANLNIAERRLPQDGRIKRIEEGRPVDLHAGHGCCSPSIIPAAREPRLRWRTVGEKPPSRKALAMRSATNTDRCRPPVQPKAMLTYVFP